MLSIPSSRYILSGVRLLVVLSCQIGCFGGNGASVYFKCLVATAEIDHQRQTVIKVFSYVFKWQLSERC